MDTINTEIVGTLKILYKKDKIENIDRIILMIKNNYEIIIRNINNKNTICLYENNNKNVFSCPDIDSFMDSIIKKEYLNNTNIKTIKKEKFTFLAYKLYLLKILDPDDTAKDDGISMDTLLKIMSIRYYMDNKKEEELLNYIKYQEDTAKEEILSWYQEKERYRIYKDSLEKELEYFPDKEEELVNKIDFIFYNMYIIVKNENNIHKDKSLNRIYISREDLITLFKKYLKSINAPNNWITSFDELINNNLLINGEKSFCNDKTIEIDFHNNLDDLVKLAHEFAHYISYNKNNYYDSPFLELPSIYHELNMQEYLVSLGFIEEDARSFYKYRVEGEITNFLNIFKILHDIHKLKTTNNINEESFLKEKYLTVKKMTEEGIKEKMPTKEELKKELDNEIDLRTLILLDSPELAVTSYNYILNLILSKIIIKKSKEDQSICDIMNDITLNYDKYKTLEELLKKLNIEKHNAYIKK